jgi:hypothetical protein
MEIITALPPVLMVVIGLLILAWLVLLFLVPFMIEGIRTWTRKSHEELRAMNAKLDRLEAALRGDGADSRPWPNAHRAPMPPPAAERRPPATTPDPTTPKRREPTLSELPPETGTDPRQRRRP